MSAASHDVRLRARRRLGVTTVMRAAWPSARRAKSCDCESISPRWQFSDKMAPLSGGDMAMKILGAVLALMAATAAAQDYPAREIRSICNFSAGSGADIIVRYYSDRLSKLAGRAVVVENKVGVQGNIATEYVARSKADGYTIMITPASSTLAAARHLFKQLPFDPDKDFTPVTTLAKLSFAIAVDAKSPVR